MKTTLLDKLLASDKQALLERETAVFKSKRLAKILKSDEPVEITIREIPYNRIQELMGDQFSKDGSFSYKKSARAKAKIAVEGIAEPNLKDEELQNHFDAASPADLAEKLFSMELVEISNEICKLSGINLEDEEEDREDELKN